MFGFYATYATCKYGYMSCIRKLKLAGFITTYRRKDETRTTHIMYYIAYTEWAMVMLCSIQDLMYVYIYVCTTIMYMEMHAVLIQP